MAIGLAPLAGPAVAGEPQWLEPAALIDSDDPAILAKARVASAGVSDESGLAARLVRMVRDEVPFGFPASFWDQSASAVLREGRGFCHTKTTLVVALARAAGMAARPRFMALDATVLDGMLEPGTVRIDDSVAEFRIAGRWVASDVHVVDRNLERAARARLERAGRIRGLGIDRRGSIDRDGHAPGFIQAVEAARPGVLLPSDYADVAAFYSHGPAVNRLGAIGRLIFPLAAAAANRRVRAVRSGASPGDLTSS